MDFLLLVAIVQAMGNSDAVDTNVYETLHEAANLGRAILENHVFHKCFLST